MRKKITCKAFTAKGNRCPWKPAIGGFCIVHQSQRTKITKSLKNRAVWLTAEAHCKLMLLSEHFHVNMGDYCERYINEQYNKFMGNK